MVAIIGRIWPTTIVAELGAIVTDATGLGAVATTVTGRFPVIPSTEAETVADPTPTPCKVATLPFALPPTTAPSLVSQVTVLFRRGLPLALLGVAVTVVVAPASRLTLGGAKVIVATEAGTSTIA